MPSRSSRPPVSEDAENSALRHELELSTFLNKGVLQNNAELKVRIHELERENKALRAAESSLADIEAQLEDAEKRVIELENEVKEREAELNEREGVMEEKIRDALMAKEGLERETKQLRQEMRGWREIGAGVIKRMGVAGLVKFERQEGGVAEVDAATAGEDPGELRSRGTKRTVTGSAKPPTLHKEAAPARIRVVKRDVPRQRSTPRDAPPVEQANDQSDEESEVRVKAEPVHRGYRTRTTGPAPALLRGDLRATAGPSTSRRTSPSQAQTSQSANISRKRSRRIDSDSIMESADEHVRGAHSSASRVSSSSKARADARRNARPQEDEYDRDDGADGMDSDDRGQGEDEEEGEMISGEDDEKHYSEGPDEASMGDRSPTPVRTASRVRASANAAPRTPPPRQVHSTTTAASRPSAAAARNTSTAASTSRRPGAALAHSFKPDTARTSRPSSPRLPSTSSTKTQSRTSIGTTNAPHRSRAQPDLSSSATRPAKVKRNTAAPSTSASVKPEAGPRDIDDHWGQPIIVKKERFSLSPDPQEESEVVAAAGRRHGLAGSYDPLDAYDTDDDPLAADI